MNRPFVRQMMLAAGLAASIGSAWGQLVVGNDSSTGQLFVVDVTLGINTRSLGSGTDFQVGALAADNAGQVLYWIDSNNRLMKAPFVTSGSLAPVFIGTTTAASTTISISGLAFDASTGQLIGYRNTGTASAPEGFYEINTQTGLCTLILQLPDTTVDYGGFEYEATTDAFYALNDTATGRGIYRFSKPLSTSTATLIGSYPGTDADIDGLAAAGGKLYLVNDAASQGASVFDLASGTFDAPITTLPFSATGTNAGGAFAPGLLPAVVGADLSIAIVDSPDPVVVPPGSPITYQVTVGNNGPDTASGVAFTSLLPSGLTFVSGDAGVTHSSGVVSLSMASLASGQSVTFNFSVQPQALGTFSTIGAVSSSTADPNGANNSATATTTVRVPLADVASVITGPADCALGEGGTAVIEFRANNTGPEAAENVTLTATFPANVTFVSSDPPLSPAGNTLTLQVPSIAAAGSAVITATFTVGAGSTMDFGAAASGTTSDPSGANNTTTRSIRLVEGVPDSAPITAIFSTIASSGSSVVPGIVDARFSTGGISRPYFSPDESKFILVADTDLPTAFDEVAVRGSVGGPIEVVLQEGITQLEESDNIGAIDDQIGINNAGNFAFSTNTDAATNDEVVVKSVGGTLVTVAREGLTGPLNYTYGTTSGSASIQEDNTVTFYSSISGEAAAFDTAYFTDDGASEFVHEGVTIPTGQLSGTDAAAGLLATTASTSIYTTANGASFSAIYDLAGVATTSNRCFIVDNSVRAQEGFVLPGSDFTSPLASASPTNAFQHHSGSWMLYGSNADGADWVVRDGAVVAKTGDEIFPGAGLFWGASFFTATYFMVASNNAGDSVVGGVFEGPDLANAALVLNGERIIARENDPIDLNGDGVFNDGYYLRTFINNNISMTSDAVYCVVRLRSAAAALCGATDTDEGQALIRIPLTVAGSCPGCAADFNEDGGVDGSDIEAFFTAWEAGDGCGDTNLDGGVDGGDIEAFFVVWEAGGC